VSDQRDFLPTQPRLPVPDIILAASLDVSCSAACLPFNRIVGCAILKNCIFRLLSEFEAKPSVNQPELIDWIGG
jgi:hypothetical protein